MTEWLKENIKLKGDIVIWRIVFVLSIFSVLAVYSSTGTLAYKYQSGNTEFYLFKHLSLLLFGLVLMYLAHLIDHRYFFKISQILLYVSILLLPITLFFGTNINEAKRWLVLPIINLSFQTSDLAKFSLIMFIARVLSKNQDNIGDFKKAFVPIIIAVGIVCALIAPANLSTAAVLFGTSILLMIIGRIRFKHIAVVLIIGAVIGLCVVTLGPRRHTYKSRIEAFIHKKHDNYQSTQAKIAIANGGVIGKGPGNSRQRNFIPHPYSDFIYAIIIEEYGLIGGGVLIFLYLLLMYRGIKIVIKCPRAFGALLAIGLCFSVVIQAMLNMAVTVNLLPVTGLPLPLVSMGGTSIWFTCIAIGIILSISRDIKELEDSTISNQMVNVVV